MMMKDQYEKVRPSRNNRLISVCRLRRVLALAWAILALYGGSSFAQTGKQVTGTVLSALDNSPIPGVSVLIKGSQRGTTTDVNGSFSIDAEPNNTLVFSFIGYQSEEVVIGNKTVVNITLAEDIAKLNEVVVVGYGTQKTRDLSSSQSNVTELDIKRTVNTSIDQALQGRAPNVFVASSSGKPGAASQVYIRGISTINGNTQPLYVIDGVQILPPNSTDSEGQSNILGSLNPDDIESMNVLTGPGAQSIYGSRASNGVIVITTKKGKAGKTRINFTSQYNIQTLPKIIPTLNLREYAEYSNAWSDILGYGYQAEFADPSILGEGTNWQKALFKSAAMKKQQLSVSGGTDKTTYYISAELLNQDGLAPNSGFDRKSIRLNLENQLGKFVKLGTNLSISGTSEKLSISDDNIIQTAIQQSPATPLYNGDGSWGGPQNVTPTTPNYVWVTNPVALAYTNTNNYNRVSTWGTIYADVNITQKLTGHVEFNGTFGNDTRDIFNPSYQFGANNSTQGAFNLVSSSSRRTGNNYNWTANQRLSYADKIGNHDFNLTLGHEAQEEFSEWLSGSVTGFTSNNIPELSAGDTKTSISGSGRNSRSQESYFARLGYIFNDKYILQASYRADGSSNFGPNNRWGFFPSLSLAWRLSAEPFMEGITNVVNDLKLRAEMGTTGNQGWNNLAVYSTLRAIPTQTGQGFIAGNFPNPDLKWESTRSYNVGLDLDAFEGRFHLVVDAYLRKTDNLINDLNLPAFAGTYSNVPGAIGAPIVNLGNMENRGVGFAVNVVPIQGKFVWKAGFNMSFDRNKLTKLNSDRASIIRKPWFTEVLSRADVNQPLWQFYSYQYDGIYQNYQDVVDSPKPVNVPVGPGGVWVGDVKFKDLNGDNVIDDKDRTITGNPWPKFTYGFNSNFSYKGFDLSVFVQGVYGNQVFNQLRFANSGFTNLVRGAFSEAMNFARPSSLVDGDESVVLLNPGTDVPRVGSTANANNRATDKFVEDGSYLRVKNISLSYSLPRTLFSKYLPLENVRFTAGVQNAFTITKYKGYDPEVGTSAGVVGFDNGRYPASRMYTFAVSVDF
jgi:TonB-dependent starch-binding outer membrane protein SusC